MPDNSNEPKQPSTLGMIGAGAAGQMVGFGLNALGMGMQRNQARKLRDIQLEGNKQALEQQRQKEMQMWKDTNYPAQVEQMKLAGLNPGLQYGMSGGGGATTGGTGPSIGGQQAQMPHLGNPMDIAQLAMMAAQKANIEADTALKETQAGKLGGIDTKEAETRIQSLLTGIDSEKAKQALTRVQTSMEELRLEIGKNTQLDTQDMIHGQLQKLQTELNILYNDETISSATVNDKINTIHTNLVQMGLQNELIKAKTNLTEEQIYQISEQLSQNFYKMGIDEYNAETQRGQLELSKFINNVTEETKLNYRAVSDIIGTILNLSPRQIRTLQTTQGPKGTTKTETHTYK